MRVLVGQLILAFILVTCAPTGNETTEVERPIYARVIGGQAVKKSQWPWLVALVGKIPTAKFLGIRLAFNKVHCGASLINDRWLLTAAHCFGGHGGKAMVPKYWHAQLGDTRNEAGFFSKVKSFFGKIFNRKDWVNHNLHASKIIIHPRYRQSSRWFNDIALIKLEKAVPIGNRIKSVPLPTQGDSSFPADGQNCVMKGWGCTAATGGVSKYARQVTLPKVRDAVCRSLYQVDTTTRLCAGYNLKSKGICSGDSGGPLVCSKNGKWVQVGIASFGSRNKPGQYPGAFTRVSTYVDWIKRTIQQN